MSQVFFVFAAKEANNRAVEIASVYLGIGHDDRNAHRHEFKDFRTKASRPKSSLRLAQVGGLEYCTNLAHRSPGMYDYTVLKMMLLDQD